MPRYGNGVGTSGIVSYEIGDDSITIVFKDGSKYLYTYAKTGKVKVDGMKALAKSGRGLNGYINRHVRRQHALKLR